MSIVECQSNNNNTNNEKGKKSIALNFSNSIFALCFEVGKQWNIDSLKTFHLLKFDAERLVSTNDFFFFAMYKILDTEQKLSFMWKNDCIAIAKFYTFFFLFYFHPKEKVFPLSNDSNSFFFSFFFTISLYVLL